MTKEEALASAITAIQEAEKYLRKGNDELSYSWSVIADTWASVAKAIEPNPQPLCLGYCQQPQPQGEWTITNGMVQLNAPVS